MMNLSTTFTNVLLTREDDDGSSSTSYKLRVRVYDSNDIQKLYSLQRDNMQDLLYGDYDAELQVVRQASDLDITEHEDESVSIVLLLTTNLKKEKLKNIQFEGKRYGISLTFKKRHPDTYVPMFHLYQLYRPTPEHPVENDDVIEDEVPDEGKPVIDPQTLKLWLSDVQSKVENCTNVLNSIYEKLQQTSDTTMVSYIEKNILSIEETLSNITNVCYFEDKA